MVKVIKGRANLICMHNRFSLEILKQAVASSISVAETLRKLGYQVAGGNYNTIYSYVKKYELDVSHWKGQSHAKGKTHSRNHQVDYRLLITENSIVKSNGNLKLKLIKNGLLSPELGCSICGIKIWLGKHITLQMDHINGIRSDNRLENLRLICPNCHSQTDTFGAKNKIYQKNHCSCGPCSNPKDGTV
jgi:5-methylcytosine-specific restriction endonuclease McrA